MQFNKKSVNDNVIRSHIRIKGCRDYKESTLRALTDNSLMLVK